MAQRVVSDDGIDDGCREVWIVHEDYPYEHGQVIGVFANEAEAIAYVHEYMGDGCEKRHGEWWSPKRSCSVTVTKWTVGETLHDA